MELRHLDTCSPSPSRARSPRPPTCCRRSSRTCPSRSASSRPSSVPSCWCAGRRGAMPTECGDAVLERARRIRRELEADAGRPLDAAGAPVRARQPRHRRHREPLAGAGAGRRPARPTRPGVQLRINEGASERLAAEVLAGELAQAVVTEPMTAPRLVGRAPPRRGARRAGARRHDRARAGAGVARRASPRCR